MKLFRELAKYRNRAAELKLAGMPGNDYMGMFIVPSPTDRGELRVIASNVDGWEHASVSRKNRCPNWPEMDFVKRLFWRPDECCMQLHVPDSARISCHPFCLHIWRPSDGAIPRPPDNLVGPPPEQSAAIAAELTRMGIKP